MKKKKAYDIAKKSLITEKIKKNEILKFYILGKSENRLVKKILKGIYAPLGINNENEFVEYLKNYNLSLKEVSDKIEIEILWNKLIYSKYKNQININHESLKNKISVRDEEQKSYNLSEIVFLGDTKSEILNKHEKLKVHINELGFAKTALLYSQSDSNNKSGLLGWIYEGQLSQVFKDELKNLKKDQITKVLNVTGGALILKINDIKIERKKINLEVEMKKNVKFETEKQLNNFSLIYFNKVKNILVNEKN